MEGKIALQFVVVHTGTRELKIVWKLIQENYEFSSAERCSLNTHTILWTFYGEKIQAFFPLLYGFRISVEYIKPVYNT